MGNVFLTADLHFGHKNIITFEDRPFQTVEEMDIALIKNWNTVVSKDDTVFVAGDVSFYNKVMTANIIQQLKGNKVLVMGNHDKQSEKWWSEVGFASVYRYPIIYKEWFVIQHEPPTYYNEHVPYFYIYGHVHGCELYRTITKQSACVCVERWDYKPVLFDEILEMAGIKSEESEKDS